MPPFSTLWATAPGAPGCRGCSASVSRCDEERHRHAPLPLPRQRPVRTVLDHAVAAAPCPSRDRIAWPRCRARAVSRNVVCRLSSVLPRHVVHAGEPLRRRAIDDRRLVPPAVHVAVRELLRGRTVRPARAAWQRSADSLPRSSRRRKTAALPANRPSPPHGIQDLVVLHAVAAARLKVFDAIGRRRMHDAGALLQRHVVDRGRPATHGRRTDAGSG